MMTNFIQRILDKTLNVNHDDSIMHAIMPDMIPSLSMDQTQENVGMMASQRDWENTEEKHVMANKITKKTDLTKPDLTPRLQPTDDSFTESEKPLSRDIVNIEDAIPIRSQTPEPKTDLTKPDLTPRLQPTDDSFTESEKPLSGYETGNMPDKTEKILNEKVVFPFDDNLVTSDDAIGSSVSENPFEKNSEDQITGMSPRNDPKRLQPNEFETHFESDLQIQNKTSNSIKEDTVITINIGRVEVHAAQPTVDKKTKPANIMSLADYIKLRSGDRL